VDDRFVVEALVRWFRASARDLPWRRGDPRTGRRDPYRSLVSEVMLQQTQVARVLEKFAPFIDKFPSVRALADAEEEQVLASWAGMGYYRRARLLQGAAREMVGRHGGEVPADTALLRALPGVGRYTAGALASICFGAPTPIVDGNVKRVLMRLAGRRGSQSGSTVDRWAWARAEVLVRVAGSLRPPVAGEFNEGLMELGATVCTPRRPRCEGCPVRTRCSAYARGLQEQIPEPKAAAARRDLFCVSVIMRDGAGRLLVERRPDRGMWAGMWQAPTLEAAVEPSESSVRALAGGRAPGPVVARFDHGTTHREVRFVVRRAAILGPRGAERMAAGRTDRRWLERSEVAGLALSNPQRRVLLEIEARAGRAAGAAGVP
jgi:A/G-specific adenine glycosylase